MAQEIRVVVDLSFVKESKSAALGLPNLRLDMAGDDYVKTTQLVGLVEAPLSLGSVTLGGYACILNRGENPVLVRPGPGQTDLIRVSPGRIAVFETVLTSDPHVAAVGAPSLIELLLIDA